MCYYYPHEQRKIRRKLFHNKKAKSMRKKVFGVIFIISAMFYFSSMGQAQSKNGWPTNLKFNPQNFADVYMAAVELNHRRFDDVHKINVGDTILFPARTIDGTIEYWVADEPSAHDGKHDCIWRLTERYVAYQLVTEPAVIILPAIEVTENKQIPPQWVWWVWLALFSLAAGILIINWLIRKRPVNPDRHQPIGGNMDVLTREQNLTLIMTRYLLPGERLISFRRGTLVNSLNQRRFSANMHFGDNVRRNAWMNAGERVSTAIIEDINGNHLAQHFRNACSNGFGSGLFTLPNGWFIQYDETEEAGRVATDNNGHLVTPDTAVVAPNPTPIQTELEQMLTAISKIMPKGTKSFNLEYEGDDGKKKKIKLDMK